MRAVRISINRWQSAVGRISLFPLTGENGFTLIELLVALAIFSVLMTTAGFSLRMAGTLLTKVDAQFAIETRKLSQLRDSIASCYFYVGQRSSFPPGRVEYYYYFYGEEKELRYVSAQQLSGRGGVTLNRLRFQDGALTLEEEPLYGLKVDFIQPVFPSRPVKTQVLMAGLKSFKIDYFRKGRRLAKANEILPDSLRITYRKQGMTKNRELFIDLKSNFTLRKELLRHQSLFDMDL